MKDIKRMTHQGSHLTSSLLQTKVAALGIAGAVVPLRASLLSALLLWSGGAIALSASAMLAPSSVMAQLPVSAKLIYVNPATGTDSPDAGNSATTPLRTITAAVSYTHLTLPTNREV